MQDATTGHGASNGPDVLNTIIKNVALLWSDSHSRWLTPNELLTAMGFPVVPSTVDTCLAGLPPTSHRGDSHRVLCSFNRIRPERHRTVVPGQAGNSMSVNVFERWFCRVFPVAGLVGDLEDRWLSSVGL